MWFRNSDFPIADGLSSLVANEGHIFKSCVLPFTSFYKRNMGAPMDGSQFLGWAVILCCFDKLECKPPLQQHKRTLLVYCVRKHHYVSNFQGMSNETFRGCAILWLSFVYNYTFWCRSSPQWITFETHLHFHMFDASDLKNSSLWVSVMSFVVIIQWTNKMKTLKGCFVQVLRSRAYIYLGPIESQLSQLLHWIQLQKSKAP